MLSDRGPRKAQLCGVGKRIIFYCSKMQIHFVVAYGSA